MFLVPDLEGDLLRAIDSNDEKRTIAILKQKNSLLNAYCVLLPIRFIFSVFNHLLQLVPFF